MLPKCNIGLKCTTLDARFFIDCHVTDGADYQYVITYVMEILGNMNPEQTKWQKNYLNHITPIMEEAGFRYFRTYRLGIGMTHEAVYIHDPRHQLCPTAILQYKIVWDCWLKRIH